MALSFRRLIAGAALIAALGGCAAQPRLTGAWYLVYKDGPSPANGGAEADPQLPVEMVDDIYVALLNAGDRPIQVDRIMLGSANGEPPLWQAPKSPYILEPGKLLVFPAEILSDAPKRPCTVPSRLYVRLARKKQAQRIQVLGSMPTSLPPQWRDCGRR